MLRYSIHDDEPENSGTVVRSREITVSGLGEDEELALFYTLYQASQSSDGAPHLIHGVVLVNDRAPSRAMAFRATEWDADEDEAAPAQPAPVAQRALAA
jgi:hypothetical protein